MTRYKLPDELGGAEVQQVRWDSKYEAMPKIPKGYVAVSGDANPAWIIYVPDGALTEVPPPIPAEPEPGVYRAWRPGWEERGVVIVNDGEDGGNWGVVGDIVWRSWEDFVRQLGLGGPGVVIRKLQPAPEPVQLPWREENLEVYRSVGCGCHEGQTDGEPLIRLDDHDAKQYRVMNGAYATRLAHALLTAADAAENTRSQT